MGIGFKMKSDMVSKCIAHLGTCLL